MFKMPLYFTSLFLYFPIKKHTHKWDYIKLKSPAQQKKQSTK